MIKIMTFWLQFLVIRYSTLHIPSTLLILDTHDFFEYQYMLYIQSFTTNINKKFPTFVTLPATPKLERKALDAFSFEGNSFLIKLPFLIK